MGEVYFGHPVVEGNTVQSGPYTGEVVSPCARSEGFGKVESDKPYTADEMRTLRDWFGDIGEHGTSQLYLDKARNQGMICINISDPVHNKHMLAQLDRYCTKKSATACDPIRETIESAIPKEHYGLMIGGALVAAVAFVAVGHYFPIAQVAVKVGIALAAGAAPFVLDKIF